MGVGHLLALLTVAVAIATPTLPWHAAPALIVLAVVARRHWIGGALGAATVWAWEPNPATLAAAILLVAGTRRSLALGALGVFAVLATKQLVAASVLPAAAQVVPKLVVTGIVLAGAACVGKEQAWALAVAGGLGFARLGMVFLETGMERLHAADRIGAVPLVWRGLAGEGDRRVLLELVRLAPDRDAVALAAGWQAALDVGWRPRRAEGVAVEVARALEIRGRGGEALRLLARHPREGEVDWLRGLLERTQGEPVRWKGTAWGPTLPGSFPVGVEMETNGYAAIEFTATAPLGSVTLEGRGSVFEGAPEVQLVLDGVPARDWRLDGPARIELPGPWAAGPHRIGVYFYGDRFGSGGDRNVVIQAVSGAP